jgi:hypothetical protein
MYLFHRNFRRNIATRAAIRSCKAKVDEVRREEPMWKVAICVTTAITIAAMTFGYAQQRPTEEDVPVLVDGRLAWLKTGLQLTPEQEAHWPAIDTAMHEFGKLRFALIYGAIAGQQRGPAIDLLRRRAAAMAAAADALTKLVEAESALYQTLDDTQKRRFDIIVHGMMAANARGCS